MFINAPLYDDLFILTVRNPQQAIALSAESLQMDSDANPGMFQAPHLRLFSIIRSSSEFVTALLEGTLKRAVSYFKEGGVVL